MNAEDDFRLQLELEEREKRVLENATNAKDPYTHVDPTDGTTYEWDHEKRAWFPKVSDDFMAAYQAAYGVATTEEEKVAVPESSKPSGSTQTVEPVKGEKRKAEEQPPGWFEVSDEHNTNVYVSNLPSDVTDDEFVEFMSKCGIIMKDTETGQLKMKLYRDASGRLKGDARCCYLKVESVELALKILNEYTLRGKVIRVERAKFQMKGDYDPTKKPKKRKPKDKKKLKEMQAKMLDWRPERAADARFRFERVAIIKNMFDPKEFEEEATLILDYQNDLREECTKFGDVKKVTIFDRHPDGVASVTFETAEMADACVAALNGRWFAKRQLAAHTYDGKTKYTIHETEEERDTRRQQWEKFLEQGQAAKDAQASKEAAERESQSAAAESTQSEVV